MMKTISKYSKLTSLLVFSFLSLTICSQSKDSSLTPDEIFKITTLNFNGNLNDTIDTINFLKDDHQESNFDKFQYIRGLKNMDITKNGFSFSLYNNTLKLNDNYFIQNSDMIYQNSNRPDDCQSLRPKDSFNPHGVLTIEDAIWHGVTDDNMLFAVPYLMYEILK